MIDFNVEYACKLESKVVLCMSLLQYSILDCKIYQCLFGSMLESDDVQSNVVNRKPIDD
jgi:hypothetical protein